MRTTQLIIVGLTLLSSFPAFAQLKGGALARVYAGQASICRSHQEALKPLVDALTNAATAEKNRESYRSAWTIAILRNAAWQTQIVLQNLADLEFLHAAIKDADERKVSGHLLYDYYAGLLGQTDVFTSQIIPGTGQAYPELMPVGEELKKTLGSAAESCVSRVVELRKELGLPPL